MSVLKIFSFLALLLSQNLFAAEDPLTLNELRFTNRASCAVDSQKPSDSAFVLLNNMDIARAIYRLAKNRGENSTELTKKGIVVYRQSVISLLQLIHKKIINRELPLLVADATSQKIHVPDFYRTVMEKCSSEDYCPELDHYIEQIWSISSERKTLAERQADLYSFDNFHSKENFIQNEVFEDDARKFNFRCHYLRKFSPLEAHLFGTKPEKGVLEAIARTAANRSEYIAKCDDFNKQENLKVALYDLKIPNIRQQKWNDHGFDYWNSLKLYFSWGFRNAPEMETFAKPFRNVFRALAIEDALILVPNSCKSLTAPKCESDYLNQNAIREFSKSSYKKNALNLDILDSIPEGAQDDLLRDPFTSVNSDILGLGDYQSSDEWLENFRENFSGSRNIVKRKLLRSLNLLEVITANIDVSKLVKKLSEKFQQSVNSSMDIKERNDLKNELFYVCSEYTFATHEELSFIRSKLDLLKNLTLVDKLGSRVLETKSSLMFSYFEKLSKEINTLCGKVNQNKIWDNDFKLDKSGFSSWYLSKIYDNKIQSTENERLKYYLSKSSPSLSYSNFRVTQSLDDVICAHEIDCARKTLRSFVDLYGAVQYADTFWSLDQKLKSPNIFNPYAERTACRVYDPWFKTKQTMFNFFTDMSQGALATVAPGILFAKLDLIPGKMVSFNQLVKDGKIAYDTKYNRSKVQAGLTVDFGNLLGVPCAITVSNGEPNPYDYFQFTGISTRMCNVNEQNQVNVSSASDISANDSKKSSQCLVCALNFETISNSAKTISQTAGPQFFMIRALVRLYQGLSDTINIPRSWEANPEYVLATFKKFGQIPDSCVKDLSSGKACMSNKCESSIVESFYKKANGSLTSIDTSEAWKGKASFKVSTCSKPILARVNFHLSNDSLHEESCFVKEIIVPGECQDILK